jgi:anti-sigma factor RsiW
VTHPGDLLSAYLDGEITPTERIDVDRHLGACEACRDEVRGLAAARAAVRSLPMLEPAAGLIPESEPAAVRRFPRRRLAWAAAAVVAGALGIGVMTGGDTTSPLDLDMLGDRHTARVVVDPGISTIRAPAGAP